MTPSPIQALSDANASHRTSQSTPARILVVDDQSEVCVFLGQILELLNFESVSETNPVKALDRLQEEDFDLIISDFKMPEMTGIEFFHAAAEIQPDISARFIFLTGDLFNMETQATIAALGIPVLGKPFRIATVEQIVGDILAKNRAVV
jgi:two-component system cell cycle response regulator CpdR